MQEPYGKGASDSILTSNWDQAPPANTWNNEDALSHNSSLAALFRFISMHEFA
jgi:hypothetical protein